MVTTNKIKLLRCDNKPYICEGVYLFTGSKSVQVFFVCFVGFWIHSSAYFRHILFLFEDILFMLLTLFDLLIITV